MSAAHNNQKTKLNEKSINRFEVWLANLDPTIGSEINKTRPVLVISPQSMNKSHLKTVIVAPMTSQIRTNFPTRIETVFKQKKGQIALDQLRAIDRARLIKLLGSVTHTTQDKVINLLKVMFANEHIAI